MMLSATDDLSFVEERKFPGKPSVVTKSRKFTLPKGAKLKYYVEKTKQTSEEPVLRVVAIVYGFCEEGTFLRYGASIYRDIDDGAYNLREIKKSLRVTALSRFQEHYVTVPFLITETALTKTKQLRKIIHKNGVSRRDGIMSSSSPVTSSNNSNYYSPEIETDFDTESDMPDLIDVNQMHSSELLRPGTPVSEGPYCSKKRSCGRK